MLLELSGCDSCSLKQTWPFLRNPRIPTVPPSVLGEERIVVLGEGPGEREDLENSVFVGTTGQVLRSTIPDTWKERLYWSNVVRCRPPGNRAPKLEEVCCCSTLLEKDFEEIRPHAILAVGGVALDYFWAGQLITAARGVPFPIQLTDNSWIWGYSVFHPSYVSRGNRYDGVNPIMPIFRTDLEKFFRSFPKFLTPPSPPSIPTNAQVAYPRSLEEVKNLFSKLKEPFGYDIETSRLKPYHRDARIVTTAFSDGELSFAFPVNWPGQLYNWGDEALGWCLSQNRQWIAHNAPFELCWSWYTYSGCDLLAPHEDTQAKARIFYERKSLLSLDAQSRIHIGKSIKEVTKVDSKKILSYPLEEVLYYNALDAWCCWAVDKDITLDPIQKKNYERILETNKSVVTMELLGLPVDLDESTRLEKDLGEKQRILQQRALDLPEVQQYSRERKAFSISAPIDVGAVLVSYCGLQLPKTEKGNYSTDEYGLQELSGKHPLVDLVLDYREIAKLNSTYVKPILNGNQLGADGLIHASYSPTLTFTGRLSSQDPNVQNWPKRKHREIRRQIKPPSGFAIVCYDYGQIEARVVAMASKDTALIRSFVDHVDMHTKWLKRVVAKFPTYLDLKARASGETEEKKIWKAARQAIKTDWTFSIIYGARPETLAQNTQMPLDTAKELSKEFWKEHPGVRTWLDNQPIFYQKKGYVELLTGMIRNEVLPGNEVSNTPIQGTATGHIVLTAQNALWKTAVEAGDIYLIPRINVHDDITTIMPDDSDLERRIDLIGKELVKPRFDFSICPLTVEAMMGPNWCDLEVIGEWEGDYVRSISI